jgi:hypothetical protein
MLGINGVGPGTGTDSFVQTKTVGTQPVASAADSLAWGSGAVADRLGEWARNNRVTTQSIIQQVGSVQMGIETTDATPTLMLVGGAGGTLFQMKDNTVVDFDIMCMGIQTGGSAGTIGDIAIFRIVGRCRMLAGTTSLFESTRYFAYETFIGRHLGTAQAGAASAITLATTAQNIDGYYNGCRIAILTGPGAGEFGVISGYVGSTRVATVQAAWSVQPDNTSTYRILNQSGASLAARAWDLEVIGNNVSDSLDIQVTGQTNKDLRWYADLRYTEIQFQ